MHMELTEIKGIGSARKNSLEEAGIFSTEDLINYFPYKYYDFTKTEPYAEDGRIKLILAQIIEPAKVVKTKTSLSFVTAKVMDEIGHKFTAVWYNQTYIKNILFLGGEFYLYGKNSPSKKNNFVVSLCKEKSKIQSCGYLPVYHTISGVGQKILHDSINKILESAYFSAFTPDRLLSKYNLINLKEAYTEIHNPTSEQNYMVALESVQVQNLIPLIAINEYNKKFYKVIKTLQYNKLSELKYEYEKLLPFSLTSEQKKAIYEIEADLGSKFSMNRLLQGDVGSGKTVVSFFGAFVAAKCGYQAAIIAPTEILANQHYETAKKLFQPANLQVSLLTGSLSKIEKAFVMSKTESGEANIIIGTHAMLSENVKFQNLAYIVIDEQHRFGVEQRAKLKNKGHSPDILVMSATPIPRSLSLVIYGDLELSTINFRPHKTNVTTNIVSSAKQEDMWKYIDQKIGTGSKVYVVCSHIDEENEDDSTITFSAKSMYNQLSNRFNSEIVGLIHGKLSKDSQNKLIEKFKTGEVKILVSTTIVEVGMDIPDSDIMIIATPERFGLGALHQLRGRIGRNGKEAFCFCLGNNLSEKSYERIKFFKDNNDGFKIAEYDLKSRGAGSILGTNQHGEDNGMMNLFSSSAYSTAKQIYEQIKQDPSLHAKVLEQGNKLKNYKLLNKIILN